jgi:hypothetical protein
MATSYVVSGKAVLPLIRKSRVVKQLIVNEKAATSHMRHSHSLDN